MRVAGYPLKAARVRMFLTRLKTASGVDPDTGPHLKLLEQVDAAPKPDRFVTHLDRRVWFGGFSLGPGDFEFVLLLSDSALSRLYVKDLRLFGDRREIVQTIHLAPTDDPYPYPVFVYEDPSRPVPHVREIRLRLRKIIPLDE
jgi:hypothetical protein